ncbi:MAG: hypothetical protein OEY34_02160 [Cyclobacteriaceae bacterium]|nr:hypothetical protein [Cyclobacteriaceae bacterium]
MRIISFFALLLFINFQNISYAQPSTEVYLLDVIKRDSLLYIENPRNISNNFGYDNQPYFLPDGTSLFYSSQIGEQTDIIQYDLRSGQKTIITSSAGSEYSPALMPDQNHISTVILEKSGMQLLWKYNLNGTNEKILVPGLKIGYYTWLNSHLVASFVLGDVVTLQITDINTYQSKVIFKNIGRSLHTIPGSEILSFVDKNDPNEWIIKSYDWKKGTIDTIIALPEGCEDYTWTSDGSIIVGQYNQLFIYNPKSDTTWKTISIDSRINLGGAISRLAINNEKDKIAIVVEGK